MTNLRKVTCLAIIVAGLCSLTTAVFAAAVQHKPRLPMQISIAPAQPGLDLNAVKPGDVVELKVTASSAFDAAQMLIEVQLSDGVEHVTGSLTRSGPAVMKEGQELIFSVRVPAQGIGRIKARVSVQDGNGKEIVRSAQYLVMSGKDRQEQEQQKMKTSRPAKKDSKGRPIVEY